MKEKSIEMMRRSGQSFEEEDESYETSTSSAMEGLQTKVFPNIFRKLQRSFAVSLRSVFHIISSKLLKFLACKSTNFRNFESET